MDHIFNIGKSFTQSIGEFFDGFLEQKRPNPITIQKSKPVRQKKYSQTFCRNKYKNKCKSTIKRYESGEIVETSHSKGCVIRT